MKLYRQLIPEELSQLGDVCFNWGAETPAPPGFPYNPSRDWGTIFRPVELPGWIALTERRPAKEDADMGGRVIVWDAISRMPVMSHWKDRYLLGAHDARFPYWRPCPPGPEGEAVGVPTIPVWVPRDSATPQENGWHHIKNLDGSLSVRLWEDGMWWNVSARDGFTPNISITHWRHDPPIHKAPAGAVNFKQNEYSGQPEVRRKQEEARQAMQEALNPPRHPFDLNAHMAAQGVVLGEGQRWHREDLWTADMLPPVVDGGRPWRPLLWNEAMEAGWDEFKVEPTKEAWTVVRGLAGETCFDPIHAPEFLARTRRPMPATESPKDIRLPSRNIGQMRAEASAARGRENAKAAAAQTLHQCPSCGGDQECDCFGPGAGNPLATTEAPKTPPSPYVPKKGDWYLCRNLYLNTWTTEPTEATATYGQDELKRYEFKQVPPPAPESPLSTQVEPVKKSYYTVTIKGVEIDVYDILAAYGVTNPAAQHGIKKGLRSGNGHKTTAQDYSESAWSFARAAELESKPK